MKSSKQSMLVGLVITSLVLAPLTSFAEESATGTSGNQGPRGPKEMMQRKMEDRPGTNTPAGMKMRMENGTSGKPIPPGMENMMEKRDQMKERMASGTPMGSSTMKDRMDKAKENMKGSRESQMKEYVKKTIERMRAAIEREMKLADRMQSRIDKMKAGGATTTAAETALAKSKDRDGKGKAAITAAETLAATFNGSSSSTPQATGTNPKPGMGMNSPMRDALKKAEEAIKTAHKALEDVLRELGKIKMPKPPKTGTTTPSGTSTNP